jgi:hypothetical protein
MSGHIRNAASDELVQAVASEALIQFGMLAFGLGGQDEQRRIAESCWWWCKNNIKFVHHESLLRRYLGEAGHLQGLIAPDILIRMERPQGDCAIFTEMLCSMLRVAGVPYEIVTVAVNPSEPEIFSHVFPRAVLNDGRRLPLDASHGTYPGWQVPSSDVTRVQVWDESGNPIGDRGSRFDGLHNYGLRGLGACDAADNYDPVACEALATVMPPSATPGVTDYCSMFPGACSGQPAIGPTAPAITVPSQTSAQWAPFAALMVSQGFKLADINAMKPGMSISPSGQMLYQNPGYAVGTPTSALNLGAGFSPSTLMLGGLVLGGFVLMSMGKK